MATPGGQRTVQRLVDDNYSALYRYAYRLSGSAADAEDLTQEAFCKAQTNFAQLRDPAAPGRGCSASSATPTCTASGGSAGGVCVARQRAATCPNRRRNRCPTWTPNRCSRP